MADYGKKRKEKEERFMEPLSKKGRRRGGGLSPPLFWVRGEEEGPLWGDSGGRRCVFPRREIGFFFSLLLAEAEAEGGPLETGGDPTRSMSFPPLFSAPTLTFFSIPFTRRKKSVFVSQSR